MPKNKDKIECEATNESTGMLTELLIMRKNMAPAKQSHINAALHRMSSLSSSLAQVATY